MLLVSCLFLLAISGLALTTCARLQRVRLHASTADIPSGATCDSEFGATYLSNWRERRSDLCANGVAACWSNPAAPLIACLTANLTVRPSAAVGGQHTGLSCSSTAAAADGQSTASNTAPLPAGTRPATQRWLGQGAVLTMPADSVQALCSGPGAVSQPVLLVHRGDTTNIFHSLE